MLAKPRQNISIMDTEVHTIPRLGVEVREHGHRYRNVSIKRRNYLKARRKSMIRENIGLSKAQLNQLYALYGSFRRW